MATKLKIRKLDVKRAIKNNDTQEEAADSLGISRKSLYNLRKDFKMKMTR